MAALARYLHHPSRRNHGDGSRRIAPLDLSGRRFPSQIAVAFSQIRENVTFKLNVHVPHHEGESALSCGSIYSRECVSQKTKSEHIAVQLSRLSGLRGSCIWPSDIMEDKMFGFLKALVFTNIWMLTLPLEVLAGTCESDKSVMKMPLLFAVAMIGAAVGGLLARRRRDELKRLNDQLRQINEALRRQAKIESYAPSLSYAPVSRIKETDVIVDPRKQELLASLRTGKNFLRNQNLEKAFAQFKEAFELAQIMGDHFEEKKAARGLGASLQRQGKYREAIKYYSKVLEISKRTGEDSGITEAYGAIADCYTELGDLERAAKFYDKYIARLETD
ncbi:unnamed protein product [Musa acuminata subsp. malaccensis]|uniref:(wild Malaysian banana) hypothetical protein n=1 Tax=Musa acuminata subsp. malaccensis TaxID=214687 RepID=A0A804J0M4_MUSAM|nr:PREDICTED: protein FLUORESCENT IN BLUE LIGHT, chloroplastic isoform X1 [Musa acuminata subsp. malaccensis]CAG1837438.1 unnamed protein product [Musa acuminata subsp. malaccensis]